MPTFWVRAAAGEHSTTLDEDEIVAGRAEGVHLLVDDPRVSRSHFLVKLLGGAWFIRDLGSANGTLLNGTRVQGDVLLRDRDVIAVGDSSIVVGLPSPGGETTHVEGIHARPLLTPREQEVLSRLCEPLLGPDPYAQPASVREVAAALHVTPDAVKKCLTRLYEKFEIGDGAGSRRVSLARQAILSQSVRPQDR